MAKMLKERLRNYGEIEWAFCLLDLFLLDKNCFALKNKSFFV